MVLDTQPQPTMPPGVGHARIKVVGVGGAGVNALRRMAGTHVPGVEMLCVNTDAASLGKIEGVAIEVLGSATTRGLGAGGNPLIGRAAADESRDMLKRHLRGMDLVFIAAGMGGGTGTGAAPVVADIARDLGALTVAIVTLPFGFEGGRRKLNAESGLSALRAAADCTIAVSNDKILGQIKKSTSANDAFAKADKIMVNAITAVSRVINEAGDINVDFADIKATVERGGAGMVAVGQGTGTSRVLKAAQAAVTHPLLEKSAHGAKGVLYTVTAGPDLTLAELTEATQFLSTVFDPNARIFFGVHLDPERAGKDEAEVILIATHLPEDNEGSEDTNINIEERVRVATSRYFSPDEILENPPKRTSDDVPSFLRELKPYW